MTGDEIIALARAHFGEETAQTVSTDNALDYLNISLQELFNDLPPSRIRNRLAEDSVALVSGQGGILNTWDRIVEIYVDDNPGIVVPKGAIEAADYGTLFAPAIPIVHFDDSHIWVRPTGSTVKVVHLEPPTPVTEGNRTNELAEFDEKWHPALAFLVASYMYAQEEDQAQAGYYKSEYMQMLSNMSASAEEES